MQGGDVKLHLLITRYSPERAEAGGMLPVNDIVEMLGVCYLFSSFIIIPSLFQLHLLFILIIILFTFATIPFAFHLLQSSFFSHSFSIKIKLVGVIPESPHILESTNVGKPVITRGLKSDASLAYSDMVDRFLGEDKPMNFITPKQKSFFQTIMDKINPNQ